MKVMNAVNLLPVVAYFVPRPLQFVAGIFPTYWPMRALWSASAGESYGAHLLIGTVISAVALLLAVWLFDRRPEAPATRVTGVQPLHAVVAITRSEYDRLL